MEQKSYLTVLHWGVWELVSGTVKFWKVVSPGCRLSAFHVLNWWKEGLKNSLRSFGQRHQCYLWRPIMIITSQSPSSLHHHMVKWDFNVCNWKSTNIHFITVCASGLVLVHWTWWAFSCWGSESAGPSASKFKMNLLSLLLLQQR